MPVAIWEAGVRCCGAMQLQMLLPLLQLLVTLLLLLMLAVLMMMLVLLMMLVMLLLLLLVVATIVMVPTVVVWCGGYRSDCVRHRQHQHQRWQQQRLPQPMQHPTVLGGTMRGGARRALGMSMARTMSATSTAVEMLWSGHCDLHV